VHKRLNELEDPWGAKCTDETKLSRVCVASEQRIRIVVSRFSFLSCILVSLLVDNMCTNNMLALLDPRS